jgi:carbonic anhydrase/acetyltransferase-like protein (isoleucine patch superfamily)
MSIQEDTMVLPFRGSSPRIAPGAYLAPTAVVIGDVEVGDQSSIWFGAVARGDEHWIRIGRRTNVQDGALLHVTGGRHPISLGDDTSIGHGAVVHGCTVGGRVLVGMGAVILDGARIAEDTIVGAGAVVSEGSCFPPRSVLIGVPARRVREATEEDLARILHARDDYQFLMKEYQAGATARDSKQHR